MKKLILGLALLCCLVLVVGCGGNTTPPADTTQPPADNGSTNDNTDTTTPPTADAVTIKIGSVGPESGDLIADGVQQFKKYIEENADGRLVVELFPNAVLGGDTDMAEQVSNGLLEMANPSFASLSVYDERIGVSDMNFIFTSPQAAEQAMNAELGDFVRGLLAERNIIIPGPIVCTESLFLMNNVRPIASPEDMAGLKIRTQQSNPHVAAFSQLGANATPMSFSELFSACQNGTVDGCENNPSLASVMGFAEVQKYGTKLDQVQSCSCLIVSKIWYDALDPELQQIVVDGLNHMGNWQRERREEYQNNAYQMMEDAGMEATYLTDEQMQAFRDKAWPYFDQYIEKWGQEIFDMAWKYND